MRKWLILILITFLVILNVGQVFAEDIALPVKQDDPSKLKMQAVIITPAPVGGMLPAHPYLGCSVALYEGTATTAATVITGLTGQTIIVYGYDLFNKNGGAGDTTFYWDTDECLYGETAACKGSGFLPFTYLTCITKSFKVTSETRIRLNVYYKQIAP